MTEVSNLNNKIVVFARTTWPRSRDELKAIFNKIEDDDIRPIMYTWSFSGFQEMTEHGELADATLIKVIAPDIESALAKAIWLVEKNFYRVMSVEEIE